MSNIKWNKETLYLIPPPNLTKEQLFFWRIKNDRKFYIENFLKIRDKTASLTDFKFNVAQNYVYEQYLRLQ